MRQVLAVIMVLLALASPTAHAQCTSCPGTQSGPIKVVRISLYGSVFNVLGCFAADTDFDIDLSTRTDWGDHDDGKWVIQVFDCRPSGLPTNSIGHVNIVGTASGLSSLAVLVAGPSASWSESRDDAISSTGCVDFAGLTIEEESVRLKTRVSIAVSGDITSGDPEEPAVIHANQIVRIQADGVTTGTGETATVTGGTIEALITADGGDTFGANTTSIGHIRAWNAVKGSITALDKDIFTVRITGVANASRAPQGLLADVIAEDGHIFTLWSSGPIGPVGVAPAKLYAGGWHGQFGLPR